MKRILLAILVVVALIGCTKKPKEEYIPLFDDGGKTYYVATPSGTIVWSTNSETYYAYVNEDGSVVNINDYIKGVPNE